MRKSTLFLILIFIFSSCSNDDDQDYASCINNLSVQNGFIYKCDIYKTEAGQMKINNSSKQTTSCMLEFVNSKYSDFVFEDGDSGINIINIWISIPSEYYDLQEIPVGTYELREYNEDPLTLDIVELFRVGPEVSIFKNEYTENLNIEGIVMGQPMHYDRAELTIDKLTNGAYEINYLFEAYGKMVKGNYTGTLSFAKWD